MIYDAVSFIRVYRTPCFNICFHLLVSTGSTYGVDKEQIESVLSELKAKMAEENVIEEEDDDEEEGLDEDYETEEEED